ncbi:MAG: Holliday junction branch migration protein RuvA, partial [Polyangiaceae bacterium]|nr:Holliday junction branch migration protein RuvA [Polyangiaceae bacterium]
MIGRLTGSVVDDDIDGNVILDVGGVGYELLVPLGTIGRARVRAEGLAVTLFVHTHVREDAIVLFGFASRDDRMAFRTLLGVSSIGPRTALAILSMFGAAELARAVQGRDVRALTQVPGVGKKSAERILLELDGKLAFGSAQPTGAAPIAPGPVAAQVIEGLTRMGFKP